MVLLVAGLLFACTAPTPAPAASGPPRVSSVAAVGDTITVSFTRPMLQMGEASGVEMRGNYQLDTRALPSGAKIGCRTRDCMVVAIDLPAGSLAVGTHTLRVANVVSLAGPGLDPDPTTITFTRS